MTEIIPAIIPKTLDDLKLINLIEEYVDWVHIDIMDGIFVKNKTILDKKILSSIKTTLKIELHLMVSQPQKWLDGWENTQINKLIFHRETLFDPSQVVKDVKKRNLQISFALNPETPTDLIYDFMPELDSALIMAVHPGKGGQKFLKEVLPKIKTMREKFPQANIAVDGGINQNTARLAVEAGANILVVGSYIFKDRDKLKTKISKLPEGQAYGAGKTTI